MKAIFFLYILDRRLFLNPDYIEDIGHSFSSKFEAFQNAKNVPSNLLAGRRSNYAFLGLMSFNCSSMSSKDGVSY